MIGHLKGTLAGKQPPRVLLDVGGVGYELEAPMSTFYDLPETGEPLHLHTHMVVREDAQLLYGFYHIGDRDMFRNLLRVNGVGPRMGLAILSGLTRDEFIHCVRNEDLVRLTRVPGVGRKTAERLIVEMRDRLTVDVGELSTPETQNDATPSTSQDALHALQALGYKPKEAERAVRAVQGAGLSTEELIREALQQLSG